MTVTQSEPLTDGEIATDERPGGLRERPDTLPVAVRACAATPVHPRPTGRDRYTISEVAEHTGLSAHTLRWYERIGLMPHVDRTHTGQRRFTNRDLDWLSLVTKLRLTGMPVADMVRYAELVRAGEATFTERRELLTAHREDVRQRIAELHSTLDILDYKIGIYADTGLSVG
ncbi:MerR family transcriptional regulator [Streptomyces halobius]|uniref:MerR family transcriptional regulator n=1 Tax=Streptomyces halobius TaxID=2879846 RepID=A0ABY4MEM8_9ACTN|nr:MerR family transcriptional regulator [Streptomyces halobius]UQA95563.1 MerR family transcriptional regulator [Streptomyces halobius]